MNTTRSYSTRLAPLFALGALAAATACKPALPPEAETVFKEAQDSLRSDDYAMYPAGEKKLNELIEKYPDNVLVITWLAQMYLAWSDQLQMEQNTLTKMAAEYQKKAAAPGIAEADKIDAGKQVLDLNEMAKRKYNEMTEIKRKGFKLVEKAISMDTTSSEAQRAIADYYRIQGDKKKVEDALYYVEREKPNSAGMPFIRGAALLKENKFDEALPLFEEAIKRDANFMKAHYFKGLAQDGKGDKAGAKGTMEGILKISKNHPGAKVFLNLITLQELVAQQIKAAGEALPSEALAPATPAAAATPGKKK